MCAENVEKGVKTSLGDPRTLSERDRKRQDGSCWGGGRCESLALAVKRRGAQRKKTSSGSLLTTTLAIRGIDFDFWLIFEQAVAGLSPILPKYFIFIT